MKTVMSTPEISTAGHGRARQRARTLRALLQAAKSLIEQGKTPTVAEAADAADVSRATAYRYFPSQEALLAEAAVAPAPDASLVTALDGPDAPTDVEERVVRVHDLFFDYISSREAQFRIVLRAHLGGTLEGVSGHRPGYRVSLLDKALAPLAGELTSDELARLATGLSILIGTEAVLVTRDVLDLDLDTARAHTAWACRQLVRAAREEALRRTHR